MRALVYEGERRISFQEDFDIHPLSEDEVGVRISFAGICGSDVHGYLGHDPRRTPRLVLGHEASGVIEGGAQDGQAVVINPLLNCGLCSDCLDGRMNVCSKRTMLSIPPKHGCLAEKVYVPQSAIVQFDVGRISMQKAALTEPLACSWHAVALVDRLSILPMRSCRNLILGGGAIGLGMALVLRHFGVEDITIFEPNLLRHGALKRAGNFRILSELDNAEHGSFGIIFDAYGGDTSRETACKFIRPNGIVLHIGLAGGSGGLDVKHLTLQEVIFVGSYAYTKQDFCATLKAIENGDLGDLDWVDIRPFAEGAQAFEDIVNGVCAQPKVMLKIAGEQR